MHLLGESSLFPFYSSKPLKYKIFDATVRFTQDESFTHRLRLKTCVDVFGDAFGLASKFYSYVSTMFHGEQRRLHFSSLWPVLNQPKNCLHAFRHGLAPVFDLLQQPTSILLQHPEMS